jgi:hypothetical protein
MIQQALLEAEPAKVNGKRKSPDGEATTDLVFTSYACDNADVFPRILSLHVRKGATIADVTYGRRLSSDPTRAGH